jgi:hypothetical protein
MADLALMHCSQNWYATKQEVNQIHAAKSKHRYPYMRYEIFTAAKIHTVAVWAMTPCSLVRGNQRFGETHCLNFKDKNVTVKTEAVCYFQTLVSTY